MLRDYQLKIINSVNEKIANGVKSILICSPVGSGKTVVFSALTKQFVDAGLPVLILAHRQELIDQISEKLGELSHSIIANGKISDPTEMIQVGMIGSVGGRMENFIPPSVIILDEVHHVMAKTWRRVLNRFSNTIKIGVTATPCRLDGAPLGEVFTDMIMGPQVAELINAKYLSPYKIYAKPSVDLSKMKITAGDFNLGTLAAEIDRSEIFGDAIKEYQERSIGKRAIVFCVSIDHAKKVAKLFAESGHKSAYIDGEMSKQDRDETINKFRRGEIKILTSCNIVSEGFDLPAIECAIILRPTASLALWIQQCGRVLRYVEGKTAIILDHSGNTERHGFPCEKREWSLIEKIKPKKSATEIRIKTCPSCFAACAAAKLSCPYCSHEFKSASRGKITETNGDLVLLDPKTGKIRIENCRTLEQFKAWAVQKGKKEGYGYFLYKSYCEHGDPFHTTKSGIKLGF